MPITKPQLTGYKYRLLQATMTKAYNTAASRRQRINETSNTLVCKLNAGRIRHQLAKENLEQGRSAMIDRILNTRDCAEDLLRLNTKQYSEESRRLQDEADSLVQGPLRFVSDGVDEESLRFQKWEEDALKFLDALSGEAEGLRRYLVELAGQAQLMGVEITWWGNPEDPEARVERLEEGEVLDL